VKRDIYTRHTTEASLN